MWFHLLTIRKDSLEEKSEAEQTDGHWGGESGRGQEGWTHPITVSGPISSNRTAQLNIAEADSQ